MTARTHYTLIVDAKTQLVAEAVAKALGIFRFPGISESSQKSLEFELVWDRSRRDGLLNRLLNRARTATADGGIPAGGPLAILQEIGPEDFDRASEMGFECGQLRPNQAESDRTGDHGYSHPLRYRMQLRDFAVDLGWDEPLAAFAAFSLPIVYFGWSRSPLEEAGEELHFLDSSIWHRYVVVPRDTPDFELLVARIDEIIEGRRRGIFRATVALEYLDYAIGSIRNLQTGAIGHGPWVKTVPFQSETWADAEASQIQTALEGLLQRRVLLVDDFGGRELRAVPALDSKGALRLQETRHLQLNKKDLIETALKATFSEEIHSCSTLNEARKKLEGSTPFDLILLDYLLGQDSSGHRKYGTALLDKLERPTKETATLKEKGEDPETASSGLEHLHSQGHSGPMNRFWVFSVSAFPFIMESKIAAGSVASLNPAYVFDPGADPVSTPNLFRYKLLRFLQIQQRYAASPEVTLPDFLSHALWSRSKARKDGFMEQAPALRHWARRLYFGIMEHQRVLQELQFDEDRGSLLARSVLSQLKTDDLQRIYFSFSMIFRYLGWGTGMEYEQALDHLSHLEELLARLAADRELLSKLEEDIAGVSHGYV